MIHRVCEDQEARFAARMAFFEVKLALKPEQRQAWQTFVSASREAESPVRNLCQSGALPPPPHDPVARLDLLDRRATMELEMHQAKRAALARLREALEPEQVRRLAEALLSAPGPAGAGAPPMGGPFTPGPAMGAPPPPHGGFSPGF
jgi:hypothetical protein